MKESVSISVGTDFFVCKGDTNFCKIVTMTVLNRQLRKVSNGSGTMVTKSEKGEKQKLVRVVTKMHEAKFPLEQIAAIAEISMEKVKEIIG